MRGDDYDNMRTKLVAVSLVSMINGFQHDLKALCDIAHSRGALVYADIIQGAGAVPIDVHAWGVDFCACATYKWLMGDFGVGLGGLGAGGNCGGGGSGHRGGTGQECATVHGSGSSVRDHLAPVSYQMSRYWRGWQECPGLREWAAA